MRGAIAAARAPELTVPRRRMAERLAREGVRDRRVLEACGLEQTASAHDEQPEEPVKMVEKAAKAAKKK